MLNIKVTNAMFALLRTVLVEGATLTEGDAKIIQDNIEEIYLISKRNDMAHLVGYALEKAELISSDNPFFVKLQEQAYLAIFRCEGMEYEISRMRKVFEDSGIDFVLLKGAVMRKLYPEGWMRTSSDIDILVRADDHERAGDILADKLRYKKVMEGTHDHSFFSEGGVHVELHFTLVEEGRANRAKDVLSEVWSCVSIKEGSEHEYELSPSMFYFYHIAHLAKHFGATGSGMRPFIDIWLINNRMEKNEKEREEMLLRGSLNTFAQLCDQLSAHWLEEQELCGTTAQEFEYFVLNCGIYGSEENRILIAKHNNGGTFVYILRRLFLPYKFLAMLYPVLKKHKWLMPFCQVARWCKLFSRPMAKKAIAEVKISRTATQDDVDGMQAFLTEIGL